MKGMLLALIVARALDATSTCAAFNRGATEANPLIPTGCRTAVAVQAGVATAQTFGLLRLHRHHPKVALAIALATVGIEGYAVVSNSRAGR
jgi:hypothetical protein